MKDIDTDQLKKNLEKTFDDVSTRYDENKFFAISANRMAELVPYSESMNILDVSTGTGLVAIEVARKHPHARIEAIDLSQGMLKQAEKKAHKEGIDNITFRQCDVESITYDKEMFDAVTCGYALFFYPDMNGSYLSISKTIKPGGTFAFSSFTEEAFNPYAESFLKRLETDYKVVAPSRLRERLKTEQHINELIAIGNYQNFFVELYPIRYSLTINEWWSLLNNAGYKSLIDQLSPEQLVQFKQEHLKEIEKSLNRGVIELNADTLFGIVNI
ncbi:MAG: methyltransferase domain-containing protein [Candidatus Thiodiazotropha sp. 6PLUC2]